MVLAASGTLTTEITKSGERSVALQAKVDFEGDGYSGTDDISKYAGAFSVQRAFTTDVPDGVRLVTGYASAQATQEVGGDPNDNDKNGAHVWSPAEQSSPYCARRRITSPAQVNVGAVTTAGLEVLPRFTGFTDGLKVDGGARTGSFTLLDGSSRLHTPVRIPMVANGYIPGATQDSTVSPSGPLGVRPGLNGLWPIDYTFRKNGYYASPPIRANAVVSATMHGSAAPEVGELSWAYNGQLFDSAGTLVSRDGSKCVFDQGQFSSALVPPSGIATAPGPVVRYTPPGELVLRVGSTFTVEGWFNTDAGSNPTPTTWWSVDLRTIYGGVGAGTFSIIVGMNASRQPYVQANYGTAVTTTAPGATGWVYVQAAITIVDTTHVSAVFTLNAAVRASITAVAPTAYPAGFAFLLNSSVQLSGRGQATANDQGCRAGVEALQITTEASPPSNNGFTPTASLERSLNDLTVIPFMETAQDAWSLLQDISNAELGSLFFSESGIATFWNREHFTKQVVDYAANTVTVSGVTSPIIRLTSARSLKSLTTNESRDSIRNHIILHATTYQIQPGTTTAWQASGDVAGNWGWHSGQTRTFTATFKDPVIGVSRSAVTIPLGGNTGGFSGYRACSTPDGLGAAVENLVITIVVTSNMTAQVTIWNQNLFPIYLCSPSVSLAGVNYPVDSVGQPMFWLWARPVISTADLTESATAAQSSTLTVEVMDAASMDPVTGYGEIVYENTPNGWQQQLDVLTDLANSMLSMTARPGPVLERVEIVGDARLQMGDRCQLVDTTGMAWDGHIWIVGNDEGFDAESSDGVHKMDVTGRMCAAIGQAVWGEPASFWSGPKVWGGIY